MATFEHLYSGINKIVMKMQQNTQWPDLEYGLFE